MIVEIALVALNRLEISTGTDEKFSMKTYFCSDVQFILLTCLWYGVIRYGCVQCQNSVLFDWNGCVRCEVHS